MFYELEAAATVSPLRLQQYNKLLSQSELKNEDDTDYTVLLLEGERLLACGSLKENVLKQIAVDKDAEGGGACARVVSALITEAFNRGYSKLFLFTKPKHERLFLSLSFYPIAQTQDVLMMENVRDGIGAFLRSIPKHEGKIGCVVCHCNPLTNGHMHLFNFAAEHSDWLYIFVVSEEGSLFPFKQRLSFVTNCVSHLSNVTVLQSGPYMVSKATFPTYFLKETIDAEQAWVDIDLAVFSERIAPALNIDTRFVGQEPFCPVTHSYNQRMKEILPQHGIKVEEIPRLAQISATKVREYLKQGRIDLIKPLVPEEVYAYCKNQLAADA